MARHFRKAGSEKLEISSGLGITARPLTMACWCRSTNLTDRQAIMSMGLNVNRTTSIILAGNVASDPLRADQNDGGGNVDVIGFQSGRRHHVAAAWDSTTNYTWLDGRGNSGANTTWSAPNIFAFGYMVYANTYYFDGDIWEGAVWNVKLNDGEVRMLAAGLSPLFVRPQNLVAYYPLIQGGGSYEYDWKNKSRGTTQKLTATGTRGGHPHQDQILYPDDFFPANARLNARQWSWYNRGINTAAAGSITGTLSKTLGGLTLVSAGQVLVQGSLAKTLGVATVVSEGDVLVSGALNKSLGALTLTGDGDVLVSGSLARTLGALTLDADGTVSLSASLAKTLGALTLTADGDVLVQAVLNKTLGALTLDADGIVGDPPINGALSRTLGALTLSGAGGVLVQASLARTLGNLSPTIAGTVLVQGSLAKTLGAVTLSSAGTVLIQGALGRTLGVLTLDADGTVVTGGGPSGSLAKTLGVLTLLARAIDPPLNCQLRAFWRMDELSGQVRRDLVGDLHAVPTGIVTAVTGQHNNAAQFDPTGANYLQAPDSATLEGGNRPYTIAGWFKLNSLNRLQTIWGNSNTSQNSEYRLLVSSVSNRPSWTVTYQSGGFALTSATATHPTVLEADRIYLVIVEHDPVNDRIGISLDGGAFTYASYVNTPATAPGPTPLTFGHQILLASGQMDGWVDHVGFWDRLLSTQNIADLYAGWTPFTSEAITSNIAIRQPTVGSIAVRQPTVGSINVRQSSSSIG